MLFLNKRAKKKSLIFLVFVVLQTPTLTGQGSSNYPDTYLTDKVYIAKVRDLILAGDKRYDIQHKALIHDADKLLTKPPRSVMEKVQMPPSGDKHDYMSLAPYFWPDSSKPDGLPYISKDGQRNPEINEISDKELFTRLCHSVYTLSIAYCLSGKSVYSEKAVHFLKVWFLNPETKMNPNLNFAQMVRGVKDGKPFGIIDSRELIFVVDALGLLKGSAELDAETFAGIKQWFSDYFQWLYYSPNGMKEAMAANNHGTWYAVQALSIALFLEEREAVDAILKSVESRIDSQIKPDGTQPFELKRTTSLGYSHFNLRAFAILCILARNRGRDFANYESPGGGSIRKAFDFLFPFANGEQQWKYQQIKEPNRKDLSLCYVYGYYLWGENRFLKLVQKLDGEDLKKSSLALTLVNLVP